mmetsp:Transcript_14058/g.36974  ORF Transcript_14058/g.36974 Transcript_14058/m.36974 type:complete len:262 (+) Transcript_14058:110-895(+)
MSITVNLGLVTNGCSTLITGGRIGAARLKLSSWRMRILGWRSSARRAAGLSEPRRGNTVTFWLSNTRAAAKGTTMAMDGSSSSPRASSSARGRLGGAGCSGMAACCIIRVPSPSPSLRPAAPSCAPPYLRDVMEDAADAPGGPPRSNPPTLTGPGALGVDIGRWAFANSVGPRRLSSANSSREARRSRRSSSPWTASADLVLPPGPPGWSSMGGTTSRATSSRLWSRRNGLRCSGLPGGKAAKTRGHLDSTPAVSSMSLSK